MHFPPSHLDSRHTYDRSGFVEHTCNQLSHAGISVDGLSRGDLSNGDMTGQLMLDFAPIDRPAHFRSSTLHKWLIKWAGLATVTVSPKDWLHRAHQDGHLLWIPASTLAEVAVEQLRESQHTCAWNSHIVVFPRLCCGTAAADCDARGGKECRKGCHHGA
jgi:hypothetical protein